MPTCGTCIRWSPRSHRPGGHRHGGPAVLLAVACGGATGALLRHGVDVALPVAVLGFPWPTLLVNVTGATALAVVGLLPAVRRRPVLLGLLGPGLLGGWTTLSAYAEQGRRLLEGGRPDLALGYLLGTLAACIVGCLVGAAVGRRLTGPAEEGGGR